MIKEGQNNTKEKGQNPKIGRPVKTTGGIEFKKDYLENEIKFQLECQLLATIYERFFVDPPSDPNNRRVQIEFITVLFQKYQAVQTYRILLNLNQFFYKNSSVEPLDKVRYTSLIDVSYMFKQLRLKRGVNIRGIELILAVIFFLYNEKLINLKFYQFITPQIEKMQLDMVNSSSHEKLGKIEILIVNLVLELAIKEQIKILVANRLAM